MKTDKAFAAAIIATFSTFTMRADHAPRAVLPDAVVDVRTIEGVAYVKGEWRYSDTHIHKIEHKSVGPDLKASGAAHRTFDFAPDARGADYDDSTWEVIPADSEAGKTARQRPAFLQLARSIRTTWHGATPTGRRSTLRRKPASIVSG
jgi:hypothetical protein